MVGGSRDQRGNIESVQRDGPARVKAVDAFRLPVRQNNNTCLCPVSRPTTDINFYPPKKKNPTLRIVSEKTRWNTGRGRHAQAYFHRDFVNVYPKRIDFNAIMRQCKTKRPQWLI